MQEALEKWSVELLGNLLPRHLELAYLINYFFLERISKKYVGDDRRLAGMSLIEEGDVKKIRMANLVIILSLRKPPNLHSVLLDLILLMVLLNFTLNFSRPLCSRTSMSFSPRSSKTRLTVLPPEDGLPALIPNLLNSTLKLLVAEIG